MENVTIRRHQRQNISTSSFESINSDYLSKSLPDLSTGNILNEEIAELKEEVENLKRLLQSANDEIDNLISENNTLKKNSLQSEKQILKYKKICSNPSISTRKSLSSKKKSKLKTKTIHSSIPKLNLNFSDLALSIDDEAQTPDGAETKTVAETADDTTINTRNMGPNSKVATPEVFQSTNSVIGNVLSQSPIKKPCIFITGGQQCTGLASELISSREDTKYEQYDIFSFTKPQAPSDEIITSCENITDSEKNYVILCIGENDKNPYKLLCNLVQILRSLPKTNFIVLNIRKNIYLNENLLNNLLYSTCNNFINCKFLNIMAFPSYKYNKKEYLLQCCKKINYILDMQYYKKKFLTINKINKNCKRDNSSRNYYVLAKPGTIPYYFPIIQKCSLSSKINKHLNTDTFFRS